MDEMLEQIKKEHKATDVDISALLGALGFHLYANPDLTPEEGLQDLMRDPKDHVIVPDEEKDIQWNEHFILIPMMCRICYLRTFKVLKVTKHVGDQVQTLLSFNSTSYHDNQPH